MYERNSITDLQYSDKEAIRSKEQRTENYSYSSPEFYLTYNVLKTIQSVIALAATVSKADSAIFLYPSDNALSVLATNLQNKSSIEIGKEYSFEDIFPLYSPNGDLISISDTQNETDWYNSILTKNGFQSFMIKSVITENKRIFGYIVLGFNDKASFPLEVKENFLELISILERSLSNFTKYSFEKSEITQDNIFKNIINDHPSPIYISDKNDDFVYANNAFYEMTNLNEWELIFFNNLEICLPALLSNKPENDVSKDGDKCIFKSLDDETMHFSYKLEIMDDPLLNKTFKIYYLSRDFL